jgi:ribosomal protein S18 acetylase RimI-like enzyme
MSIEFQKISNFNQGKLLELLTDAYSFDFKYEQNCKSDWKTFDDFFFNNLHIADTCGFITTLNDEAIGFVTWDPRNMPAYAEIGHNCIISKHKGNGYGIMQLQEAVNRIGKNDLKKIIVTTNVDLIPAQRMYEKVGFKLDQERPCQEDWHINYVYFL